MKVLMTCDAVGGVWHYANDLAQALADEDVDVVLAILGPAPSSSSTPAKAGVQSGCVRQGGIPSARPPSLDPGIRRGGATVETVHTNLPLDWLAASAAPVLAAGRTIAALAAEHRVDLIHLNSPALAAAGPFPAPVLAVAHGCVGTWFAAADGTAPPPDLAWHGELMRAGLHAADVVVTPSAGYAATVQSHYDLPVTPTVIHNGRAPVDLPDADPADHVLTAGRLWDRVKNTALLDQVAARLPLPLRAAGSLVAPHGEAVTTEHLHLLGTLDAPALAAEYAAQPIFVSAARFEPFGLAVLEAAQAGCPLILSTIDTFRELWTGAALFVADDDPAAWVAAIARVRADPSLRAHLADAARLRAARYTVAAMVAGTLALYRDLLAEPAQLFTLGRAA